MAGSLYGDLTALDRWLATFARKIWRQVSPDAVQAGLIGTVLPALMPMVTDVQMSAVDAAEAQLAAWDSGAPKLDRTAFAGYAPNGAPLAEVAVGAAVTAMTLLRRGEPAARAMRSGSLVLERDLISVVHDTGRQALQVGIVGNKVWTKYRRYVEPGACSRCIILAGVEYRWSEGFKRHPKCRCHHEPVTEDAPESKSPQEIFESMSRTEQDRIFTPASALAIRDGADMNQLVNARRGMSTISVGGQDVKVTSAGTTRRGYFSQQRRRLDAERGSDTAEASTNRGQRGARGNYRERRIATPRLLPEEIYKRAAGDRDEAIRLLRENAYYVADSRAPRSRPGATSAQATSAERDAPVVGGGGGGNKPPMPPVRGRTGGPDDESERDRRQSALGIEAHGERLETHEIDFVERFQRRSERVEWIARDSTAALPTNDFLWLSRGSVEMELKSTQPKYQSIKNHIHGDVVRAAAVKQRFMIDLGAQLLTPKLRTQLSRYNQRNPANPVRELWVLSDDGASLEQIDFQA